MTINVSSSIIYFFCLYTKILSRHSSLLFKNGVRCTSNTQQEITQERFTFSSSCSIITAISRLVISAAKLLIPISKQEIYKPINRI